MVKDLVENKHKVMSKVMALKYLLDIILFRGLTRWIRGLDSNMTIPIIL